MQSSSRALTLALVSLLTLSNLAIEVSSIEQSPLIDADDPQWREYRDFKEFQEFLTWKQASKDKRKYHEDVNNARRRGVDVSRGKYSLDPPPINQAALMARFIVNQAEWTSVATVSSRKDTENYPFVNIVSFSDGPLGNGTGIPYLFLTPLDYTAQDVFKDNRATLMMSLAQGHYCAYKNYDPMDPRCARVILSGKIKAVQKDDPEYPIAKDAVYGRHPWLAHMPEDHHFFFAKLKLGTIAVLDTFGGPKYITIKDYLNPPKPKARTDNFEHYPLKSESKKSKMSLMRILNFS